MAAAFWSRFKRFLLSRTYGCRGSLGRCNVAEGVPPVREVARCESRADAWQAKFPVLRGGFGLRLDEVSGLRRVDLDAGAHGRGHHDRPQVLALGGRRLRADELLDDGLVVLEQL